MPNGQERAVRSGSGGSASGPRSASIAGMDSFGEFGTVSDVEVDVVTDAYRISGTIQTRFSRVTDILNQQAGAHLTITRATISEHADPAATVAAASILVAVSAILVMSAPALPGGGGSEMRIAKRPVRAQLAVPPLRVTGTVHVTPGGRPSDGVMNMTDRFLAMTDATISSAQFPDLEHNAPAVAVARDHAQVLLMSDDERPDELLADVLDERTAEEWLRADHPSDQPGDQSGDQSGG